MSYIMDIMDAREEARAEGLAEGRAEGEDSTIEKLLAMSSAFKSAGREDELIAALHDKAVLKRLLKEFSI